jgi:hypothetical protein
MPASMVARVPPTLLHGQHAQAVALLQPLRGQQLRGLVALAAQAYHQRSADVGVLDVAADRAAQEFDRLAGLLHAAARTVREGHDAIDVGIVGQPLGREPLGDLADDGGRAVDGGDQPHVVARGHAAVLAHEAHEGGALGFGQQRGRLVGLAKRVVAVELTVLDALGTDRLARRDVGDGKADGGVVLEDGLALGDGSRGDLVARLDRVQRDHAAVVDRHAGREVDARYDEVVRRVHADHGVVDDDGRGAVLTHGFSWGHAARVRRCRTLVVCRSGRRRDGLRYLCDIDDSECHAFGMKDSQRAIARRRHRWISPAR